MPRPLETHIDWTSADVADPRTWTVELTSADHCELDAALAYAKSVSDNLLDIGREDFPLDGLARKLEGIERELIDGRGFTRISALDHTRYSDDDLTMLYWGIGLHLGDPWPQNAKGHVMGDVTDQGKRLDDPTFRGNELGQVALDYHTDGADVIGLMCLRKAARGGLSCVANAVAIYNELVRTRPDLAEVLFEPQPYDTRGEQAPGAQPYYLFPVFTEHSDRFFIRFIPAYIRASQRHPDAPRLSPLVQEALDTVSAMARDPRHNVYMDLEPGEMQFINNYHVLHGRTSYEDDAASGHKRHFKRLWLATNVLKDRPAHFRRNVDSHWIKNRSVSRIAAARAHKRNGMPWNYGDLLEAVAAVVPPEAPIYAHGDAVTSWGDGIKRMSNLARAMIARGAKPKDKVAFYLRNSAEYTEALGACFLARLTHVNINYRYKPDEVRYILDNSDAHTLIYAREFRDAIAQIHNQLPTVKTFIEVDGTEVASFAENYETLATKGDGSPLGIARSPDDQIFIYTGGTTGMPKGVIYQHGDLMQLWLNRVERLTGYMPPSIEAFCGLVKMNPAIPRVLPACPQMHGTGLMGTLTCFLGGGCVVTVDGHTFDPAEVWSAVEKHKVTSISVVGDPFAKPMLRALDEAPGHYDLASLTGITSSGAMFTEEVKDGLIRHIPALVITDSFASTEAMGMGVSTASKDGHVKTADFQLTEYAIVIDENDNRVGPGESGLVAFGGPQPLGYYKDDAKTAKTFRIIEGKRYAVPGDFARVEADGSVTLLGRGSNCINTAGEKVFPEEVEEALKTHPSVDDALVLGVPDEKWGQAVTGIVVLANGSCFDEEQIRTHVRSQLAGYKTPKRILIAGIALRAPNGKADYKAVGEFARRELGLV